VGAIGSVPGEDRADGRRPELVLCTTCDEPFVPRFPRLCEWCGHQFEDGYEVEPARSNEDEPITGRAIAVMVTLALLGLALALYFVFLV